MEKVPKFESGWNKDGMIEETVTEEDGTASRRAVGMRAFESEEEKEKFIADRKRSAEDRELLAEKEKFESKVENILTNVYMANLAKPSLKTAIQDRLSNDLQIPKENIKVKVDEYFLEYWVEIKGTKYGDLEFDFERG